MLNHGPKGTVDAEDTRGRTPIFCAAETGNDVVLKRLLEEGADATHVRFKAKKDRKTKELVRDEEGSPINDDKRTVLMAAALFGQSKAVEIVLQHMDKKGKDDLHKFVNAVNGKGESALNFCCRYGHTEVAKLLLDYGLELGMEVKKSFWTSLHRAAANGHEATVRELLRDLPKDARGGRHCGSPPTVAGEAEPALTRDPTLNDQQFVSIKLRDHQNDAGVQTAMKMMIGM